MRWSGSQSQSLLNTVKITQMTQIYSYSMIELPHIDLDKAVLLMQCILPINML